MTGHSFVSNGSHCDLLRVNRGTSPLMLSFPHSGEDYPDDFGHDPALRYEQIDFPNDKFVDELFEGDDLSLTTIKANFPRTYIDVNRHQHDIDVGMLEDGADWYGRLLPGSVDVGATLFWAKAGPHDIYARKLTTAEMKRRLARFFTPYHQTMTRLIEELREVHGCAYIVDCHSMTRFDSALRGGKERPQVDIGTRRGGSCDPDLAEHLAALFAARGYDVGINRRYIGGEITLRYGWPEIDQHILQVELRRDLYMDEQTRTRSKDFLKVKRDCVSVMQDFKTYVEARANAATNGEDNNRRTS